MSPVFRVCSALLAAVLALPLAAAHGAAEVPQDAGPGQAPQGADFAEGIEAELRAAPFELRADALRYDIERERYEARGHVVIEQAGRTLRADRALFDRAAGRGVAIGNVVVIEGDDVLRAERVEFSLVEATGSLSRASLDFGTRGFRARAAEIEKTGDQTFRLRDGFFTTCRCSSEEARPPWAFHAAEAEVEVEGYGSARDVTFEVFGVPVLWLPWIAFPAKSERQTGFLVPEFSLGSLDGIEVGLPFFWAPADEVGVVLTPLWASDRGAGVRAALDYATAENSGGEWVAEYGHDLAIDADSPDEPFGRDRWSTRGAHGVSLGADTRVYADYAFASDNEVPFDLTATEDLRFDRFLVSSAQALRRFGRGGRSGVSVGAGFVDDLQNPDDRDRDPFLLQRWPTARLDALAGGLGGLDWFVPSFDLEYSWFQARDRARDVLPNAPVGPNGVFLDTGIDALPDPSPGFRRVETGPGADPHADDFATTGGSEGDGRFQEGEPLDDRGHRLLVHPRLALPLAWSGLQLVPEVGWHQTFYDTRRLGSHERGFLTARFDASTQFRGRFGALTHVVEPQFGYALARSGAQARHTIFVPGTAVPQDRLRNLDFDLLTRDDADRIPRAQRARVGLVNRFYAPRGDAADALWADVSLFGVADLEGDDFDALLVEGRVLPTEGSDLRFHLDVDPAAGEIDEGLAAASYRHPAGLQLGASYRWVRRVPRVFENFAIGERFDAEGVARHIHQVQAGASLALTARWQLRYRGAYSIEQNRVLANTGGVTWFSDCGCWSLALDVKEDRTRGLDVSVQVELIGLGGAPSERPRGLLDALGALW